jgi:glycerophosphoryl diester phosphodiesterase
MRDSKRVQVYAHRGGAALRPENTIAAFDHGLALGADGLEFDVRLTRDGAVVVHHDDRLGRTTSGHARIGACSLDEVRSVDAGYWFKPAAAAVFPFRGAGLRVPLLDEVLARYAGISLIIELKQNLPQLAYAVIDKLRAAGAVERTALGSFYSRVLRAARRYEPALRTGAAREETRWALYRSWVRWPLGRPPYAEFQVPERSGRTTIVTPGFLAHAHRAGVLVKVWTVDDADDMRRLLAWGVDALITDRPDLAVPIVHESSRPPVAIANRDETRR